MSPSNFHLFKKLDGRGRTKLLFFAIQQSTGSAYTGRMPVKKSSVNYSKFMTKEMFFI
jgi:hypothetical protein